MKHTAATKGLPYSWIAHGKEVDQKGPSSDHEARPGWVPVKAFVVLLALLIAAPALRTIGAIRGGHLDLFKGVAVLVTLTWIIVGPAATLGWQRRYREAESELTPAPDRPLLNEWHHIGIRVGIAAATFGFTLGGFLVGFKSLNTPLQLGGDWSIWAISWGAALVAASYASYAGVWATWLTIDLVHKAAQGIPGWEPFVPGRGPVDVLVDLARRSAWLVMWAAIMIPGIVVVAALTNGLAVAIAVAALTLVTGIPIVLIVAPAWLIRGRMDALKAQWLAERAGDIKDLERRFLESQIKVDSDDHKRLETLLKVFKQADSMPSAPPTVDLLMRIPLVILGNGLVVLISVLGLIA